VIFKYVALLSFAATAIAGVIPEGTYRIFNVASDSTARVSFASGPVFVDSTKKNVGPFELWNIRDAEDGGYTIDNVGLNTIKMLDTFAAVERPNKWELVRTFRDPTIFNIEPAGNGEYVIKLQQYDLLWNAEPPVVPFGDVKLKPSDGSPTQRWILVRLLGPDNDIHNYDRWDVSERTPGRFLAHY